MMLIDIECTCSGSSGAKGTNAGKKCAHAEQSLNAVDLRRKLRKSGIQRECAVCIRENKITPPVVEDGIEPNPPKMWMCLQCGNQACGYSDRNHANEHFSAPRTGSHSLVIDTYQWILWCYECSSYVNSDSCRKLSVFVKDIKTTSNSAKMKTSANATQKVVADPKKVKPKFVFGFTKVVGLTNLGNTCFFNAVLQCLAQTPFLVKVLEDMQKPGQTFVLPGGTYKKPGSSEEISLPPIEGNLDYHCPLTQVLQKTLTDMQNSNGETYKPSELLNILRKKSTQCMDGGQHDSHELLRHLLELVRSEDLRRYQQVILKDLNLWGQSSKNNDDEKISRLKFYGHQASARLLGPEPVFKGILVSTLECLECHHTSPRTEPFLDLSLPVMADKPQPPSHRRKSSGFEDAFDLMNSNNNSSSATNKAARRRAMKERKLSNKQKNLKNNQSTISEENNTHDNDDPTNSENSKTEKSRDYSASGSESDVEDNAETESGTDPLTKSQEILESGYSSEKPSTLASPASPEDSHDTKNDDSSLNSLLNERESSFALVPVTDICCPLKNGGNEKTTMNRNPVVADLQLNLEKSSKIEDEQMSATNFEAESSSGDLMSPDYVTANNLISSSNNSSECPLSSPADEKEVNDEKIAEKPDDKDKDNENDGEKPRENGDEFEQDSRNVPEVDDESKISKTDKKGRNEDYSKTNGTGKIASGVSRIGINHSGQSPSRYSTCEGEFSIQSCLNQFTAQELMAGNNVVGCEACTARENKGRENGKMVCTPSTKQYLISKVPAVLILHLKRFQSQRMSFSKVTKDVKFPMVLDLAPVCKNHDEPKVYSLYGVVEHSGTLYGGHYVAYVKTRQPLSPNDPRWSFLPRQESTESENIVNDENSSLKSEENSNSSNIEPLPGRWYFISDSRVTEVDESAVLQSQAYLLFYERIL